MKLTRRQLGALAPAIAVAQTSAVKGKPVIESKCFVYEQLTVKQNAGGNDQRAVFDSMTHGKFPVEMHITSLAPGMMPHAAHTHVHEEAVMLRTGLLDVTIEGKTTRLTPGSVAVVKSNELHGWKNPGPERAEYFVIALGKES